MECMGRGGSGSDEGHGGMDGTLTGKECPKGLFGVFCEVSIFFILDFFVYKYDVHWLQCMFSLFLSCTKCGNVYKFLKRERLEM
jgi:hypothetical protein